MTGIHVKAGYPQSEVTARIIAAAMELHQALGSGFQEVIYQRALALELPAHGLAFEREVEIDVYFKGHKIGSRRVDFMIEGVLVEFKAKSEMEDVYYMQTLSYLKASGYKVGLLLNFGQAKLQIKRLVN